MALDHFVTLETFIAVARSGSFARAAEKLGLSRAMVSKHVQALEKRLATRLIHRTTRHCREPIHPSGSQSTCCITPSYFSSSP